MIYICKGCGEIFKLPCTLCKGLRQGLIAVCKGCSEACEVCCRPLLDMCGKPLGGYVTLSWIMMAVTLGCSIGGFSCDDEKAKLLCIMDIVLSVVHAFFAYYLQWRLCSGLEKNGKAEGSHKEIAKAAREIMKYDIGFCLYFFIFFASLAFNIQGLIWAKECGITSLAFIAAALMIAYGVCEGNYAFCWYCSQCCFAGTSYSKKKAPRATDRLEQPASQQMPESSTV